MKAMRYIVSLLALVLLVSSCTSKFEDLNTNPDATTQVKPSMLATKIIKDMMTETYLYNEFLCKRMFWGTQLNYDQYNRFEHGSFEYLQRLTNAKKMIELASDTDIDAYSGLFYFMKGWYFWRTTLNMGDIPYTQALDVETYRYPMYDEQKVVFGGILSDLEKADRYFSNANTFEGDPFYNGDPEKWRKATNVLRLKVLMSLSKRADDTPDLHIKESFAHIVETGVLFQSNDDNLQVEYSNVKVQHSPWHVDYILHINDWAATSMIIEPLKKYEDYRLFSYFEPAQAFTDELYLPEGETLLSANDWNAYTGLDVAAPWGEESKKVAEKNILV